VFHHRVAAGDVEVYWDCTQAEPGLVEMDGVVHNFGGRDLRFVKLNLVSVDPKGSSVSQTTVELPDIVLSVNQTSPFHLGLRTVGTEVRFDLYYGYRVRSKPGPFGFPPDEERQFYARDVCSDAQHRVQQ
jgi:hypothetical protein